jgi:hypothetical protein
MYFFKNKYGVDSLGLAFKMSNSGNKHGRYDTHRPAGGYTIILPRRMDNSRIPTAQ